MDTYEYIMCGYDGYYCNNYTCMLNKMTNVIQV